jgi:hypothetical protein
MAGEMAVSLRMLVCPLFINLLPFSFLMGGAHTEGPMPLARIITKSADDSLELSMQLRSRGFRVETVAPDYVPTGPADLEVCLEECAPEDVLTKAAVVKESEDLWIFVAPGALDERSRPMRMVPLLPQVVEFRIPEPVVVPVAEIKPKLEVAVVDVKIPETELEDDPLLCELEMQASGAVQSAPKLAPRIPDVPPLSVSDLVAPPMACRPQVATQKSVIAEPADIKKVDVEKALESLSLERIKLIPVTLHATEIPIVPARVEPKLFLYRPAPPKQRIRGPKKSYKVAFQSGPKLWRTASVTFALLVLAGLIAIVVVVRPPVATPAKPKAVTNANPPVFLPSAHASTADSSNHAAPVPSGPVAGSKTTAGKASSSAVQNPPAAVPRHRSASDDGLIAKDTVIFYNRKPAQHEAKLPPPSDVKRYSE